MAWYEQIFFLILFQKLLKASTQFKSVCGGEQVLSAIKPKLSGWHTLAYI